jgi:YD repeat-containing protein
MKSLKPLFFFLIIQMNILFLPKVQGNNEHSVVNYPRSPEAASFSRFFEMPVSLYTGSLSVSVPLYTLQVDDISIPITLSYHNAGVKVEEEASWVGLGWNMMIGGCITRNVNGRPDDHERGWQFDNYVMDYPSDQCGDQTQYYFSKLLSCENLSVCRCGVNVDPVYNSTVLDVLRNNSFYDFEPDFYNYSFGSHSGSFSFDKLGNIVKREQNNLRIEMKYVENSVHPRDVFWEITDEKGNIFEFREKQYATIFVGQEFEYTSSWFLTRIITQNQRTVDFEYNIYEFPYVVGISMFSQSYDCLNESYDGSTPLTGQFIETVNEFTPVYLKEIRTSHGDRIVFYLGDRRDLENGKKLEKVEVINSEDTIVKRFDFNYRYLVANSGSCHTCQVDLLNSMYYFKLKSVGNYNNQQALDSANIRNSYRLILDRIEEVSGDGEEHSNPFIFTYNTTPLPVKTSFSVDHWGYYNGAPNTNKLPTFTDSVNYLPRNQTSNIQGFLKRFQANRQHNESFGKACLLESITYPTKGTLSVEYEPNTFININKFEPFTVDSNDNIITRNIGYGGGFRVKKTINHDPVYNKKIEKTFTYTDGKLICIPYYAKYYRDYYLYQDGECSSKRPFDRIMISSYSSKSSSNALSGGHVAYSKVEERMIGDSDIIKTEYFFKNEEERHYGFDIKEFGPSIPSIPNLSNGLLTSVIEYKNSDSVKTINYDYTPIVSTNNYGLKVFFKTVILGSCDDVHFVKQLEEVRLVYCKYISNWNRLDMIRETVDGVTTIKTYTYDNPNLLIASQVNTAFSDQTIQTIQFKFPTDFSSAIYTSMVNRNMLYHPVEQQTWNDEKLVSAIHYKFFDESFPKIEKIFMLETEQPLEPSNFKGLNQAGDLLSNSQYKLHTHILSYDSYGNPLSVKTRDGLLTNYTWGNFGANITQKNVVGANISLSETWEWFPLIGIKSYTDQNGLKTTYEYDGFGRLNLVKDNNNSIVKKYTYHYKQ